MQKAIVYGSVLVVLVSGLVFAFTKGSEGLIATTVAMLMGALYAHREAEAEIYKDENLRRLTQDAKLAQSTHDLLVTRVAMLEKAVNDVGLGRAFRGQ